MRIRLLASLLFLSGFCALVYQMAWLREFRLIFGAVTPATAAVLSVFMGGLGAGGWWFGRLAERTPRVLRSYAWLELGIGLSALTTPWMLMGTRSLYVRTGGVVAMGPVAASLLHILLSIGVLFLPCFLMGGTLPLAVKWVETDKDVQRGSAGLLYGLNALGAFCGVVVSTFWLLELAGTRASLLMAVATNLTLGAMAWMFSRREQPEPPNEPVRSRSVEVEPAQAGGSPLVSPVFAYGAAAITGFVFFLSELVWFRLLAPLLGSSIYGFGLILSLALSGIGLGGLIYRIGFAPRPGVVTPALFGAVSTAQAFCLILPYGLGDRVALLGLFLNGSHSFGFAGQLTGWILLSALMVWMPSVLAGIQFPLLLGLLGRGRADVGRQVGTAYAWNTGGAIAGSLLGGFVLIPGLTAPGCWKLATWMTLGMGTTGMFLGWARRDRGVMATAAVTGLGAIWMLTATVGPTGAWRHSPIGYGDIETLPGSPNLLREWIHNRRWQTRHEVEGRESSLAIRSAGSHALIVSGKADGSALGDSATQTMLGLIGAILHPEPRRACVVGLGTGATAGWLAAVQGMERVDVVEIEPGMRDLARDYFGPVNRDVLQKANVRVILGDAREVLLVKGEQYDLIASEPSNPYRAGVASLYTREYYEAVRRRLAPRGIFTQWVQGYDIDNHAIRLVYATLSAVFPQVETWITESDDLLFVCHQETPSYSHEQIRQRITAPPFAEALRRVWFTESVEGVLAHHVATPAFAREIVRGESRVNTDDLNFLEYGFARALVKRGEFSPLELLRSARNAGLDQPAHLLGRLDPERMLEERLLVLAAELKPFSVPPELTGEGRARARAVEAYVDGRHPDVLKEWRGEARGPLQQLILLEALAMAGRPEDARAVLDHLRDQWPVEARLAAAHLAARHGETQAAVEHLKIAFTTHRSHPWVRERVIRAGLRLATELGATSPGIAAQMFEVLQPHFCVFNAEFWRLEARLELSRHLGPAQQVESVDAWGKWPMWTRPFLKYRRDAYAAAGDPRLAQAETDLKRFLRDAESDFEETLRPGAER